MKKYLLLAILLTIMPLVFAATPNMTSPVATGNYSDTVTVTFGVHPGDVHNVTCYYNSSGGTADVTNGVLFVAIENTTSDQGTFTEAVSIAAFTDGITYNISCGSGNDTSSYGHTLHVSGVTFDSADPTCSINVGHKSMPEKGTQQVDWTSTDSLELETTVVTIDGPETQTTLSYTDANRELTLTSQDTKYIGDWTFGLKATDRASNTVTCNETWKTYLPDGVGWEEWDEEEPSKIPGWLIIAIIGVIGYFILKKK